MEKISEYGKIGIITHLSLSWTFFAGTYILLSRGKSPQRIIKYFKLENKIPANAGSFIVAGIIYKAVMPFRLAFSAVAIPVVISALGTDP